MSAVLRPSATAADPLTAALAAVLGPIVQAAVAEALESYVAPKPELRTRAELATELQVSTATITWLCSEGMPHVLVGDHRRFRMTDVVEWLEKRRTSPVHADEAL